LIETIGLTAAVAAADAAVKSANVTLVGYELANGDGMTVVKFRGDVGAVTAAVSAAAAEAGRVGRVVATRIIARPARDLERIVESRDTVGVEHPAAAIAAAEVPPPIEDDAPLAERSFTPEVLVAETSGPLTETTAAIEPDVVAVEEVIALPEAEDMAEPELSPPALAQSRADRRHRRR
jgi:microcompartment protein CcmL/EutN